MNVVQIEKLIKNQKEKISRRQFIGSAAGGALAISGLWNRTAGTITTNKKINIGLIGCGWYGMVNVKAAFKVGGVECIALCDVDKDHLENSANVVEEMQASRPKTYKDYRDLLEEPGLNAVIIASPPQWHALPFIAALEKGLDVYCEKPLAYDIREGQAMVQAAKESEQIIQIGFQRRQSKTIGEARDYIQQGNIGRIVQVDVQIHYTAIMLDPTPQNPPASLDWDLWCGPAPKLPYSPQIGHKAWRLEKEYGNGHLVDWGIHMIDATRWILNETMPKSVHAAGGIYFHKGYITTPDILTAHFDFQTCPVIWRHRLWGAQEYTPEVSNGIFFFGEKGTVFVSDRRWVIIPKGKNSKHQVHDARSNMGVEHMADFLKAVNTRKPPICSTADAFNSTSTVQLGMIAYEMKEKIQWDAGSKQIVGNPKAANLLKRSYRSPFKHPYERI
jgi:predicted dehydrogenase